MKQGVSPKQSSRSGSGQQRSESKETARPELVDATRYDLGRLSRVVTELSERYRRLGDETVSLREQLSDKDNQLQALEAQFKVAEQRRAHTLQRLDRLIERVAQMEAAFSSDSLKL